MACHDNDASSFKHLFFFLFLLNRARRLQTFPRTSRHEHYDINLFIYSSLSLAHQVFIIFTQQVFYNNNNIISEMLRATGCRPRRESPCRRSSIGNDFINVGLQSQKKGGFFSLFYSSLRYSKNINFSLFFFRLVDLGGEVSRFTAANSAAGRCTAAPGRTRDAGAAGASFAAATSSLLRCTSTPRFSPPRSDGPSILLEKKKDFTQLIFFHNFID